MIDRRRLAAFLSLSALGAIAASCASEPRWKIERAESTARARRVLPSLGGCVTTLSGARACFNEPALAEARAQGSIACARESGGAEVCCTEDLDNKLGCWTCGEPSTKALEPSPVMVPGLRDVLGVTLGYGFACAIVRGDGVRCWGRARFGPSGCVRVPARVPGTEGATALAAGGSHACVIQGREVYCWGDNGAHNPLGFYEMGAGVGRAYDEAKRVPGLPPARALAAGGELACAVDEDGGVWCWGNARPQVGIALPQKGMPWDAARVEGLPPAADVSLGGDSLCVVASTGSVLCSGRNDVGQLGAGHTKDRPGFHEALGVGALIELAPPGYHRCAALRDRSLSCWGLSVHGSVGDGNDTQRAVPAPVQAMISGVTGVATGSTHTCALLTDHTVSCWGNNTYGQLGDGTTHHRATPARVPGLDRVRSIHARYQSTCAVREDGTVWCWGANDWGQVGAEPRVPAEPVKPQEPECPPEPPQGPVKLQVPR